MDRDTRNLLANATQALRRGLEEEFALQLEGRFDVFRDGSIAEGPGPQLDDAEKFTRHKIVEAIQHRRAAGESDKDSVDAFLREAAFTFLNRLAALKMMEARGIVQECVTACDTQGFNARGFKEFGGLAPGLTELPDDGYRLYLECLFDEIGREVGILFDRTDPASLLWPRRAALLDALGRINDPKLAGIWSEDETIGWIYQYYNDPEERRKMRDVKQGGSAAPRNSREMAVRNQFFTPRYVVEFLTDNSLGRLWYEMTKGKTSLKDRCRFLIKRPFELFLPGPETHLWHDAAGTDAFRRFSASASPHDLPQDPALGVLLGWLDHVLPGDMEPPLRGIGTSGEEVSSKFFEPLQSGRPPQDLAGAHPIELLAILWRLVMLAAHGGYGDAAALVSADKVAGPVWSALRHRLLYPPENLSKEDQLWQPVFIPHRPIKDPREIRMIDPACGSMHFGLYAFDLLDVIYREAWDMDIVPGPDFGEDTPPFPHASVRLKPGLQRIHSNDTHQDIDAATALVVMLKSNDAGDGMFHCGPYLAPPDRNYRPGTTWEIPFLEFDYQQCFADKRFTSEEGERFIRETGFWSHDRADPLSHEEAGKDYVRRIPALILGHNIHGVDIDPRAAQIAGLALWLRAQRAWQEQGLRPADRPTITRSNIVCAEPMPGEEDLLQQFVVRSFSPTERPFFSRLLGEIFKTMRLAGEAGSLLKIEDEVSALVADARAQWKKIGKHEGEFFSNAEILNLDRRTILEKPIDTGSWSLSALSGIPDLQFWEKAEERIYRALRDFAESAGADGYQRRLFADDAARGFAFIDLCRQRYDVALMNPPFGLPCESNIKWFRRNFKTANDSLYLAFDLATQARLTQRGFSGMICDRTFVYKTAFKSYREEAIRNQRMSKFVDLGWGVLDANVEVCMFTATSPEYSTEFHDLRKVENKAVNLRQNQPTTITPLNAFSSIPRSVFAYDLELDDKESSEGTPLASDTAFTALVGVTPSEVDRVYRLRWEVPATERGFGNVWADLQAGSPYCPFYYHVCHVVRIDAGTWKTVLSRSTARVPAKQFYRKQGLSFGKRTDFIYSYPKQRDQVFSTEGQAFFTVGEFDIWMTLAITNSNYYQNLINKICGQHKHSGYLRNARLETKGLPPEIGELAKEAFSILRKLDSQNELSPDFVSPIYPDTQGLTLSEILTGKLSHYSEIKEKTSSLYHQISFTIDNHFGGYTGSDYTRIERVDYFSILNGAPPSNTSLLEMLIGFLVGATLGRWDIRFATGEKPAPPEPDPFDPLPVCPPGMLQNAEGLIATPTDVSAAYPLRISWSGILVDDKGHNDDIEARLREVFAVVFPERTEEILHEACELLGVASLRDWLRKPTGFFAGHLARFTKSTRKAPIYWPLSSPKGRYTAWLYYPRLTADTLFTVLRDYLEPKLQYEERRAFQLRQETGPTPSPSQRAEIAEADELVEDLRALRDELKRVAPLFKPDLNDGVILNHAPLWRMIGLPKWRKDCQATWEKLAAGDYDWAHLALHLWPERVIPKCATDRSLAIAHDLEDFFWEEIPADELPTSTRVRSAKKAAKKKSKAAPADAPPEDSETDEETITEGTGKWRARKIPAEQVQQLIATRSSPAVKDALAALASAPTAGAAKKKATRKGSPKS